MRSTTKQELRELILLAKDHLSQEYERSDRVMADKESYEAYLEFAKQNPKGKPQPIAVKAPVVAIKQHPLPPILKPVPKPQPKVEKAPEIVEEKEEKVATTDFSTIRELVEKNYPHQKILDEPLENSSEKMNLHPDVLVIGQNLNHPFLNHYTQAINLCLGSARLITANDKNLPALLKTAKLVVANNSEHAGLTLEPIDCYLKNPSLKADLWKETKRLLSTP